MIKRIIIVFLILGAVCIFYLYQKQQQTSGIGKSKTSAHKEKTQPPQKKTSTMDDAIDYATGNTAVKAYHRSKKTIDRVKKKRGDQMDEALSGI